MGVFHVNLGHVVVIYVGVRCMGLGNVELGDESRTLPKLTTFSGHVGPFYSKKESYYM